MAANGSGAPPRLDDLNRVIQHNMNAEPGEDMTGEVHIDSAGQRWPVFRMVEAIEGRRPKRDADKAIMYHLRPDGSRHRVMMETYQKAVRTREFIKVPLGNGIVQRNFDFRPSPEEIERQKITRANEGARSELERLLAAGGKTMVDVVDAIKGAVGVPSAPRTPEGGQAPPEPSDDEQEATEDGMERFQRLKQVAADNDIEVKGSGKGGRVKLADLEAAIPAELKDPVPAGAGA